MLLIVMYEAGTWRVRPGETLIFGRAPTCSIALPAGDRGLSRSAGSFRYHDGAWWLHNDSKSALMQVTGDRGFRVDLPPGMGIPLQQWHAKVQLNGMLDNYTLRLRLPDLDDLPDLPEHAAGQAEGTQPAGRPPASTAQYRAPLNAGDRLVLAARFEEYLSWQHPGPPAPRTAKDTAARIGWQPHTVAKRCENIRDRYARLGVPGIRGPRALEELAKLLTSTGQLTAEDLKRLPPKTAPG